jgi:hypothetical protein
VNSGLLPPPGWLVTHSAKAFIPNHLADAVSQHLTRDAYRSLSRSFYIRKFGSLLIQRCAIIFNVKIKSGA